MQRKPDLFELLRVLVDRPDNPARFLLLGSASSYLVKGVWEKHIAVLDGAYEMNP